MEVTDQFHASAALTVGKSPLNPLGRRLGGPQILSALSDDMKILDLELRPQQMDGGGGVAGEIWPREQDVARTNLK
jgi:hypothetical protein